MNLTLRIVFGCSFFDFLGVCLDFCGRSSWIGALRWPLRYREGEGESAPVLFQLHGDVRFRETVAK